VRAAAAAAAEAAAAPSNFARNWREFLAAVSRSGAIFALLRFVVSLASPLASLVLSPPPSPAPPRVIPSAALPLPSFGSGGSVGRAESPSFVRLSRRRTAGVCGSLFISLVPLGLSRSRSPAFARAPAENGTTRMTPRAEARRVRGRKTKEMAEGEGRRRRPGQKRKRGDDDDDDDDGVVTRGPKNADTRRLALPLSLSLTRSLVLALSALLRCSFARRNNNQTHRAFIASIANASREIPARQECRLLSVDTRERRYVSLSLSPL